MRKTNTRKDTYMRRKKILTFLMTGVLAFSSLLAPLPEKKAAAASWPSGPSPSNLASQSAIVMELSTGTILYEHNAYTQHYPASITKIMTTLVALENSSPSDIVTFSQGALNRAAVTNSSNVDSRVGEKMTMEQCLYAIMLQSANEVCEAVAEHVAGSTENFVKMMNKKVKALGLSGTHFNNPNGLPDTKHYTTAHDMARIGREAMRNETFRKVTATRSYTMEKTNKHKNKRIWLNHHQMINGYKFPQYEYKYCIGGKTGYTVAAGNTLVTFAEKDGMDLVCVIMKSSSPPNRPNEYTDSTSLLNFGFEKFQKHNISIDNSALRDSLFNISDTFMDSDSSPVHLSDDAAVILPKGVKLSQAKQSIEFDQNAEIKSKNTIIGNVSYTYGSKKVGYSNIIYTKKDHETSLDASSREIIAGKVERIKAGKGDDLEKNIIKKAGDATADFFQKAGKLFHNQLLGSVVIIVVALLLIGIITMLLRQLTPSSRKARRRKRRRGGYASKGGRKQHMRNERANRQYNKPSRSRRRNRHYDDSSSSSEGDSKKKKKHKPSQYTKRRKGTKESFGKNFFDF